ncbi:hypothetical protein [Terribacillus sp. 7520-G]|uniref:hypothetical protein n=1 Tax=Terribacillus TaxID=459532 RepID=UPI000BA6EC35|nr:hypothetical protein [Terribacillus sp. 7520-G]PAD37860.1 hypothetical protein CHH53_13960 [Terribacillus sp. 7520-G]
MHSVTFGKILQFTAIGLVIGFIIGAVAMLGFDSDFMAMIVSVLLSIIGAFAAGMYAELYHIRQAVNEQTEKTSKRRG